MRSTTFVGAYETDLQAPTHVMPLTDNVND